MENLLEKPNKKFKLPLFTASLIALCIGLYAAISFVSDFGVIDEKTYVLFGAPYAIDIYLGQYWGVVSNSFVHVLWYQLLFNLILVFAFGSYIERRIGFFRLFIFGLIASTITSCFELAFSNDAGLGLAGVNFSLFGFLLIRNKTDERFSNGPVVLASMIMVSLFSLCAYLNYYHEWNFGLYSMISGFGWGLLVGALPIKSWRWITAPILGTTLAFCAMSLVYAPWSADWTCANAVTLHEKGEIKEAEKLYNETLEMNPHHFIAQENLKIIEIDRISDKAYKAHLKANYSEARRLYLRILKIDSKNRWARENLNHLP